MKTQKLKLTESKVLKVYSFSNMYGGIETTTSGDPTTTCSTITSTTHFAKA